MTDVPPFDPEAVIDALGPLLGLSIAPDYRPGIVTNLQATVRFAALVLAAEIEDETEAAPVFTA